MHLVTVATKSDGYFDCLLQSCQRNGAKLEVLGWGQEWKGFLHKFELMKNYVQKLPDNDIVCFIDAYDVIILEPIEKLENLFRKSDKSIIVSRDVENENNTVFSIVVNAYYGNCKNYIVNSGTYIGYVKQLKILYQDLFTQIRLNPNIKDDQIFMTNICKNKSYIDIDLERQLFLVERDVEDNKKIQIKNKYFSLIIDNILDPNISSKYRSQ
jgi:hypothetical protein